MIYYEISGVQFICCDKILQTWIRVNFLEICLQVRLQNMDSEFHICGKIYICVKMYQNKKIFKKNCLQRVRYNLKVAQVDATMYVLMAMANYTFLNMLLVFDENTQIYCKSWSCHIYQVPTMTTLNKSKPLCFLVHTIYAVYVCHFNYIVLILFAVLL